MMDEAVVNEWPGRELGVFVSIGTGKRPGVSAKQQHEWWEDFVGGGLGDFAEAKRRLVAKIEGCKETHRYMLKDHLSKRNVNPENYYRLNVEVGVGEFGMNEWSRLADISTSTRRYLSKPEVKEINESAAAKIARIERVKRRQDPHRYATEMEGRPHRGSVPLPLNPMVVELPGSEGTSFASEQRPLSYQSSQYSQYPAGEDKFSILSPYDATTTTGGQQTPPSRRSNDLVPAALRTYGPRVSDTSMVSAPSPRRSMESNRNSSANNNGIRMPDAPPLPPKMPLHQHNNNNSNHHHNPEASRPPPIPPVSPLRAQFTSAAATGVNRRQYGGSGSGSAHPLLPYPDDDGPPPVVNMSRKPEFVGK